jgi:formyl-CoA transferase
MRLGDVANAAAAPHGKPLDGVRILALEQMQALPYGTQLLARFGADVVKIEPPGTGEMGRASAPAMTDPAGRPVGATFLRNNLNKRSVTVNLKDPRGRALVLRLAPHFDVVAENSRPGTMSRLGLGYDDIVAVHPTCVYVSVSGFGNLGTTPYRDWPALAPVVEAMSGVYEMKREGDLPPLVAPMGALGDTAAALYATIGVLVALRDRDRTGCGQYVDVAMLDAAIAITDVVTNFWSMGLEKGSVGPVIMHGFRAGDGWFVLQVIREHQFAALAEFVGHSEWLDDPRFATRQGWVDHLESDIRPAVEAWAATRTKLDACAELATVGLAAGPCLTEAEVAADPHVAARGMLVEMPRVDGVDRPVLTPGNPIKLSAVAEGPETRVPWVGEHTRSVLRETLGLDDDELAKLAADGVI